MSTAPTSDAQRTLPPSSWDPIGAEPMRAELYGLESLEAEAGRLATLAHDVSPSAPEGPLFRRLVGSGRVLAHAIRQIRAAPREAALGPDAEWLLDNHRVVEEALREVRHDLPRGYYRQLPRLSQGPMPGYPRIYALALTLIAHTDSSLEEASLTRCVQSYQALTPLTIGELWAVPTMLRAGLLENLRRLAEQVLHSWDDQRRAEKWTAPLAGPTARPGPLPRLPRSAAQLGDAFIVHAVQRLRRADRLAAVDQLEGSLAGAGVDVDAARRRETQRQAANQVTIGNCITSLRLLAALDWGLFFERVNLVDPILRGDPAGIYERQDFATRDRYRRAVETVARQARCAETTAAEQVIALARGGQASPADHVGYFLIGSGRPTLERALGCRANLRERLRGAVLRRPTAVYLGAIVLVTMVFLALLAVVLKRASGFSEWTVVLALLAALLPASELAVGLVNYLVTLCLPPRVLPKLDFAEAIPSECATFVVIPSLLAGAHRAASLLERLEIHHLANPDPQLFFALLTDFTDARLEKGPEDDAAVAALLSKVADLNRRYAGTGPPRFFVFHRRRQWNRSEGRWMGWERKRGKLLEFNRLLRGDRTTSYTVCSTDPAQLPRVRYVITLDLDTQLPREAARKLIGTLAHPLNRARFDPDAGRVVEGYAVLQPRVSYHLESANRSLFSRLWAATAGLDPYATAVSDVYQDLFGTGTFTGKGIYDVDAFEAATGRTFPDNHILSHDLIEGSYARCGLVTDIELVDDFPARYHAYAKRDHRWIRGDWQLLPWLGRTVPVDADRSTTSYRRNPLPILDRWKIADNLRRSLIPAALALWLVLGWTVWQLSAWLSIGGVLLVLAWPLVLQLICSLVYCLRDRSLAACRAACCDLPALLGRTALNAILLLYQAYMAVDAIGRTLLRLFVTRRRLLEWETAASTERRLGITWQDFCRDMWPASSLAVVLGVHGLVAPVGLTASGALWLAAWFLAPLAAFGISRPTRGAMEPLGLDEQRELRRIARKTWAFFETFVGDDDHWLPPDNFQEDPQPQVAHRTSPTNQGLLLIATLSAHDLGYVSLTALLERLEKSFATFERLPRHRGHFYNWYDTRSLEPLPPLYISTVDSGNLLGCLLTLKQGLLEKIREPIVGPAIAAGLIDTLAGVTEMLDIRRRPTPADNERLYQEIDADLAVLVRTLHEEPADVPAWHEWLTRLEKHAASLADRAGTLDPDADELRWWVQAFVGQVRDRRDELTRLAPEGSTSVASIADLAERQNRQSAAADLLARCRHLIARADALAAAMDFRFLYKPERHLFAIGYQVAQERLDTACYDLLASEARLASFLAIARGDVPRDHWFHLGRLLTRAGNRLCLLSWGGTMFEYLMPQLLLGSYPGTLLTESCRAAVDRQMGYGHEHGIPWGVSESAFSSRYASAEYQYQSFGVPGLGLKPGLGQDLVIAPYATALAAMIRPHDALANFRRLSAEGAGGRYGFCEAIDYTRSRLPGKKRSLPVRCFMAHHQGMSLAALANALLNHALVRRFHAEPLVRATDLLLHERLPSDVGTVETPETEMPPAPIASDEPTLLSRRLATPDTPGPRTHLLSNGPYTVMLTNAGAGFSRCGNRAVTRWHADFTCDAVGQFIYVRDRTTGLLWSAGHQPVCRPADRYEVVFSPDKAEFRRQDATIATQLEVVVAPERSAEIRRVLLTNHDSRPHELELTSYAEITLALAGEAAPASLAMEMEWEPTHNALLGYREPLAPNDESAWAIHLAAVDRALVAQPQYETDRVQFLGRRRTLAAPAALDADARLSNTIGRVADPVFSLRHRLRLAPGASASIVYCTAVAGTRADALSLADHYQNPQAILRAFELAWAHSQLELRHLQISSADAHLYQRLAASLLYPGPFLRAPADVLQSNDRALAGLQRLGISGDRPILLLRIAQVAHVPLAGQLLAAHACWRRQGLEVDMAIVSANPSGYVDDVHQQLLGSVRTAGTQDLLDRPGGVFLRKADQLASADGMLLAAAAHVVLDGDRGSLVEQLDAAEYLTALPASFKPPYRKPRRDSVSKASVALPKDLQCTDAFGGITADGREQCLLVHRSAPSLPQYHTVANAVCGFRASESALGCTWVAGSERTRLTAWNEDPIGDPPSTVVYLRDEDTGEVWSPTPQPLGQDAPTLVRQGRGYIQFSRHSHGLFQDLVTFVPVAEPLQMIVVSLRNDGRSPRRFAVTLYAEWVLGTDRDRATLGVISEVDAANGALLGRNPLHAHWESQIAFADVNTRPRTLTGDRTEFLGRNGSLAAPAALRRVALSGRVGPGLDPCAAVQTEIDLRRGETKEVVFCLGAAASRAEVRALLATYQSSAQARAALDEVRGMAEPEGTSRLQPLKH